MATIKDVAQKAQVGVGTVSRVINQSPAVSPNTREKVLQAIQELNFTPNLNARRLSLGKTWHIAVILPYLTLPSYVERLRGVQHVFGESDYYPILYSVGSPQRRDDYLSLLSEKSQVDGLLIISIPLSEDQTNKILENEIPTVLIDASNDRLSHVVVNDISGGAIATQHLIDLGHSRIGFLSDYLETPFQHSGKDRHLGYKQALQSAGINYRDEYVIEGERGRQNAACMAKDILSLPEPPTAIFACSDTQAIGVLDAARELNQAVPDDLSIIGFDGIRDSEFLNLSTVFQPLFDTGDQGAALLLDLIQNITQGPQEIELPLKIIHRKTTAAPSIQGT